MGTARTDVLPPGKLPPALLRELTASVPRADDVILGPGVGHDVAVVDLGGVWLVSKADPITFASDRIGWYAIHVNANDLATVGAEPRWFMATLLLPEGSTDAALVTRIMGDLTDAAAGLGVSVIGGHTEITAGLDRPLVAGAMLGTVAPGDLVRPDGLRPGDTVLLTGGMAVEATSIIAREMPGRLRRAGMSADRIETAARFLYDPGISVVQASRIARGAASEGIHAMHDPTEGGVVTALEEMAEAAASVSAAGMHIEVDAAALDAGVEPLAAEVCSAVGIDPRGAISSGALLIGVAPDAADAVRTALVDAGVACWLIGNVRAGTDVGTGRCRMSGKPAAEWPVFPRDEIARLFEGETEARRAQ